MSSTGVRACSWTLRITHAFRVVVAGRQVSLELRDSSLVSGVIYYHHTESSSSPCPLLPALSCTTRLGSSRFSQLVSQPRFLLFQCLGHNNVALPH